MHFTKSQLLEFLNSHQISYQLYSHEPLFTCEQAIEAVKELHIPGMGVKNLFLKDSKKNYYLVSATYDTTVALKLLGKEIGAKELRFADPLALKDYLGVEPGSVTPLATINDQGQVVRMILDKALFDYEHIYVHPLQNSATVVLTPADLIRFFNVTNHTYMVYDFVNNRVV
jgi:Ala-tRNA(Pro) deacylase